MAMAMAMTLFSGALLVVTGDLAADEGELQLEAGRKFQKNCRGCHQPPDLRYATDLAWLDQIKRTS